MKRKKLPPGLGPDPSTGGLLRQLADLLADVTAKRSTLREFTSHYWVIYRQLVGRMLPPALDNLLGQIGDSLPFSDDLPMPESEEPKRERLKADMASLRAYIEFSESPASADWYPKYFIETEERRMEISATEPEKGAARYTLADGGTIALADKEVQRHFRLELVGIYKGRTVRVVAKRCDASLIEMTPFQSLRIIPNDELDDIHVEER